MLVILLSTLTNFLYFYNTTTHLRTRVYDLLGALTFLLAKKFVVLIIYLYLFNRRQNYYFLSDITLLKILVRTFRFLRSVVLDYPLKQKINLIEQETFSSLFVLF